MFNVYSDEFIILKVYLDAGHGGGDPGACDNGLQEKDITLAIAKVTEKYINDHYKNVVVKMSRTGDSYPTLSDRTNEANTWGADLFVSIHVNAGGGDGYETFINTSTPNSTEKFAEVMHRELMRDVYAGFPDRGIKRGDLHVLRESNMDAILTENLFIDTGNNAAFLESNAHIYDIGANHAHAIAKYADLKGKGQSNSKPKPSKPNKSPAKPSKPKNGGKYGWLKIVNVGNAAIVMDRPDRINASNIGLARKGHKLPLNGSVRGKHNADGYWEVEYRGRLGYVTAKYGDRV